MVNDIFSEIYSYDEGISLHEGSVFDYISFLQECDEITLGSIRKPSLSDYDSIDMSDSDIEFWIHQL